ncbi:MAG: DNA polymerase I [Bacteroidota bacterium]
MPQKTVKRGRLFLIDGMAIAYRSYFAFIQRPLINSKGENTSAVYGFVTFLEKILDEEKPDYIAVAMDTKAPTFRHKSYAEYKATRQKMPEDLGAQLDTLKEVVRAYGVPVLELDGYEADDIMGTLARRAERENVETYLVTSDKDFMQLVSDLVKIYKPGRQGTEVEIVGFEGVKNKFGVGPDQVIDVLGLIGDSSDNVPGVPGIGEKTAIPLIQEYKTIEALLENAESIPQKGVREKLKTHRDMALLSKQLVTIDTQAPVQVDFHTLKTGVRDREALSRLFERLEFRALFRKLGGPIEPMPAAEPSAPPVDLTDTKADKHSYHVIRTESQLKPLVERLRSAKSFVFDTETTSTNPLQSRLVGISFSLKEREAFFVPISSPRADIDLFGTPVEQTRGPQVEGLPIERVLHLLKPVLENDKIKKIGQNLKYDILALSRHGIWVKGIDFDSMVASYLLREDGQHSLEALAREHLQYKIISYDDLTGTGKDRKPIGSIPLEDLAEYSCEDADITHRICSILRKRIETEGMSELAHSIEFPLIDVLARMEHTGVAIDVEYLGTMSSQLEKTLLGLTTDIHEAAGGPFNINSTQQLSEILFKTLKLSPVRKTKTGFSTDVAVLESLRSEHPIVEKLLEYRQLAKLKSTYVDALPLLIDPATKRVHASFNQTVAATGRLSSSDPNLQNIPIRTDIGRSIRKAFVPADESRQILSADYSQIELRVMAHISADDGLREAFLQREDIHTTTAAKVFGVSHENVSRDMRRKAKEVNFGIMYGIGPFGLSRRLEISQGEAKEIIDRYFDRFPKVRQYINDTLAEARTRGYVATLLGRRRYLPDLRSKNQNVRSNAERQAINMPIQGTSADMIKAAMVAIHNSFSDDGLKSAMILQVHDELVFEIARKEEEDVKRIVEQLMKGSMKLSVPIEVEIGVGGNWLEAH